MGRGKCGSDTPDEVYTFGAGCCCLVYVVSAILVGASFRILGPTEIGLKQDTFSKTIDRSRAYESGRYFLGLARDFIRFDRRHQNIEFSSDPTADGPGLIVKTDIGDSVLDMSMQYTLDLDKLPFIYDAYELRYHERYVRIAQNAIQRVASTFGPNQFYNDRFTVEAALKAAATAALADVNATVHEFQLRSVDLPSSVNNVIVDTLVRQEQRKTEERRAEVVAVDADITLIRQEVERLIQVATATRQNEARVVLEGDRARARELQLGQEATALLEAIQGRVRFSNEQMLRYLYLQSVGEFGGRANVATAFPADTTLFT